MIDILGTTAIKFIVALAILLLIALCNPNNESW